MNGGIADQVAEGLDEWDDLELVLLGQLVDADDVLAAEGVAGGDGGQRAAVRERVLVLDQQTGGAQLFQQRQQLLHVRHGRPRSFKVQVHQPLLEQTAGVAAPRHRPSTLICLRVLAIKAVGRNLRDHLVFVSFL